MDLRVRVAGVLVEDAQILLVRQVVNSARFWSLPGGRLELGETLEQCLQREFREETGLDIALKRLLYVGDRLSEASHVLHITVEVVRLGGFMQVGQEPESDANPIHDVQMVPISALVDYGFAPQFMELVLSGFPDAGRYVGSVANIGL